MQSFVAMKLDIEMLKTAFGNALKVGTVDELDAEKGYRLKLGENADGPYLSPWYPHPETGKSSVPLKKGQIVGVINPSGDPRQGFVFRGGYSSDHPSPSSDIAANVFDDAGVRVEIAGGALKISVGGFVATISSAGLDMTGGEVRHDGLDIGSSHRHGGVTPGGATTDIPVG